MPPAPRDPTDPLRDAAFGRTPGADAFAAVAAAGADPRARWLAAVVLGGQGHYAAAAGVLRGLLAHQRPLWASLAASTLASHHRQLGRHAAARRLDAQALRLAADLTARRRAGSGAAAAASADGLDAAGARCDALTGLAADALGLGRLTASARLLAAAERAATGSWRSAVRLGWIRAELALASGRPEAAVGPARDALQSCAGAVRHDLKSRLVLAVALATAGDTHRADADLHQLATRAEQHQLLPLRWATELVLADLHKDTEHGEGHRSVALAALRVALCRAEVSLRTAAESSLWVLSGVLQSGDSAERSSAGEIHGEICTGLCQVSTPRDR